MIPMCEPDITDAERAAVLDVLGTSTLALGPRLSLFEQKLATYVGVKHGVAVSSGTAGLHLAMIAAGVEDDDLVITTPFSFVASANCVLYVRARPVFVDIDPTSLTIDVELLERKVKELRREKRGPRLRAILPVHVFGQPAAMDAIMAIARRHELIVVEDACEAIGSTHNGRAVGTFGDASVFAFYPNKQLTTGEGGMIVTDRAEWDALFRSLRNQGRDVFDSWLTHSRLGYNYRLDELSAALGAVQVDRLEELLARRARVAGWYAARLRMIAGVLPPEIVASTTRMSWFVYVVRLCNAAARDRVMRELDARGIPSRPYFSPIHLQPFYRAQFGFRPGDFPVTEEAGDTCLALPFFGGMTESQVDTVCGALEEILERHDRASGGAGDDARRRAFA